MKYVIRIVLLIVICILAYLTFESIAEPVRYAKEVKVKEKAVIEKLKVIRDAQLTYRDVNGSFTGSFDTLINFINTGKIKMMIEFGDRDDSTTVFRSEEVLVSVKDSLFKNIDIDNVRYVPDHDTLQFEMASNVITKNNVPVPVFQVVDPKPFSKERIKANDPLRVGSVYEVDYNGNWGNR